jgi:hypothetical protein
MGERRAPVAAEMAYALTWCQHIDPVPTDQAEWAKLIANPALGPSRVPLI